MHPRISFFNNFSFFKSRNCKCTLFTLLRILITHLHPKFNLNLWKNEKMSPFRWRPPATTNRPVARKGYEWKSSIDPWSLRAKGLSILISPNHICFKIHTFCIHIQYIQRRWIQLPWFAAGPSQGAIGLSAWDRTILHQSVTRVNYGA